MASPSLFAQTLARAARLARRNSNIIDVGIVVMAIQLLPGWENIPPEEIFRRFFHEVEPSSDLLVQIYQFLQSIHPRLCTTTLAYIVLDNFRCFLRRNPLHGSCLTTRNTRQNTHELLGDRICCP